MKDAMQIRFLVDKNIWELPQSKMTRSAVVNEMKAAVKVTNKSKSKWTRETEQWLKQKLKDGNVQLNCECSCIKKVELWSLVKNLPVKWCYSCSLSYSCIISLIFTLKRKTMNDNISDFLALIQLQSKVRSKTTRCSWGHNYPLFHHRILKSLEIFELFIRHTFPPIHLFVCVCCARFWCFRCLLSSVWLIQGLHSFFGAQ